MEKERFVDASESNTLAFIPLVVWKFAIGLTVLLISLSFLAVGFYHHTSWNDFLGNGIDVFLFIVKVLAGVLITVLLYIGFRLYHDAMLKKHERVIARETAKKARLQNRMLEAKIQATEQLPALIKYAMEQGHNVKFAGLEVSNYLSNVHTIASPSTEVREIAAAVDFIPEPYKFSDVLQNWEPSKSGILLAKSRELITVPIGEPLCHTTFTGNTDAGKTNNERALLIQLLFLCQCVYLCDRNYQPFREDKKLGVYYNYKPIETQLAHAPIVDTPTAVKLLKHLYGLVEERRIERRKVQNASALVPFKDVYLFFDELPAFASEDKQIMQLIGRLLRESRQYGVFFVGAAQDLLNATLQNDNGAIRDNLLTNYYGGGDMTTAKLVLNLGKGERIDETGLGVKGVTYLRAKGARIERIKARSPLSDDLATQMLLGHMRPSSGYTDIPAVVESTRPGEINTRPLKEQIAVLDRDNSAQELAQEPQEGELNAELETAYQLFIHGTKTARDVAQYMGIGKDKANSLLNDLQEMGYITR